MVFRVVPILGERGGDTSAALAAAIAAAARIAHAEKYDFIFGRLFIVVLGGLLCGSF